MIRVIVISLSSTRFNQQTRRSLSCQAAAKSGREGNTGPQAEDQRETGRQGRNINKPAGPHHPKARRKTPKGWHVHIQEQNTIRGDHHPRDETCKDKIEKIVWK